MILFPNMNPDPSKLKQQAIFAFEMWAQTSPKDCMCADHMPTRQDDMLCSRERLWRQYIKLRDAFELSKIDPKFSN